MNLEEYFGANAGKVWQALSGAEQMNLIGISKKANMKETDVVAGLGWLAREGKIIIEIKNRRHYYKLVG